MDATLSLEPPALADAFLRHPPRGFEATRGVAGLPTFVAPFDLTTTLEPRLRRRLRSLPLAPALLRALTWRSRFVGCTVTEYLPLPLGPAPADLVDGMLRMWRPGERLLIAKDIPVESPLLTDATNARAAAFLDACAARGAVILEGMELAWLPIDFEDVEQWLAGLSSGRRRDIRRKLRSRGHLEVEREATGPGRFDAARVDLLHALYVNVHAQSLVHFDFLERDFIAALLQAPGGVLFSYRHAGELIGWNLCYVHGRTLVDKFIGFRYPQAREHNLYAVSWVENLRYALEHGLAHYVAGWTDAAAKRGLGARFTGTRHAVFVRNPLLRAALRRLQGLFENAPDEPA